MKQEEHKYWKKGLKHIKIANQLTEFPRVLFKGCDTIEILDLSNNNLSHLPDDFYKFTQLKIVFFSNNLFKEFPKVLARCPELSMIGFKSNKIESIAEDAFPSKLRWLILTDNQISTLPNAIGNCNFLQKCALAGNKLQFLPQEMAKCVNLELLRISANQLQELPKWLIELPRLSWLGFSGNPFVLKNKVSNPVDFVSWNELELKEQLGEGASGIIFKANWKPFKKTVAVKLFKGEVTSDGYPIDELMTCLETGKHPHLVPLLGQIVEHPERKKGIVMELIDSAYRNLGNPPSLDSCTRDVFEETLKFELSTAFQIISSIASAMKHLHDKGILHGDLYAHNTLYKEDGYSYLGDFGAASFYEKNHPSTPFIERLDIRAFGCFMEDILVRTNFPNPLLKKELYSILMSCLEINNSKRPSFKNIIEKLEAIII